MATVRQIPRNKEGRDFVVGDIHGTFRVLEMALDRVVFDESRDRLFSVGDLIDRGPASEEALAWLRRPWFHACRGNHEQMLLDAVRDPEQQPLWMMNGGAWWRDVSPAQRDDLVEACRELPFALEIDTARGPIGIVHADLPRGHTWDDLLGALARGDRHVENAVLWSRTHIREGAPVPDAGGRICEIYCGHTVIERPRTRGKITWIDTGACYGDRLPSACLSVVQIHPDRIDHV